MRKIYAVDIDGTITKSNAWTDKQVISAKPNQKLIDKINALYEKRNVIILYTCRGDSVIPATRYWLKKHRVKYHSLNNNKLWADFYVDDKAVSPDNFTKYGK
jgi:uncharacterized HAD superfamily protein